VPVVRWDALFADMELQADAWASGERDAQVAELTRAERASVHLVDRLRSGVGAPVELLLRTGARVHGPVVDVAAGWVLVEDGRREHLVPLPAVVSVRGAPPVAAAGLGSALRRLGLGHALRALARDRCPVRCETDGGVVVGRVDAVGADHVDVGVADPADGRPTGIQEAVPLGAVVVVSRW
jgi:hypothetical protein